MPIFGVLVPLTGFGLVAVGVRSGLVHPVDGVGRDLPAWALAHGLMPTLRAIEVLLAPAVLLWAALASAALLVVRRRLRAGAFVLLASWGTHLLAHGTKGPFGRDRPAWQWAEHVHHGGAFPSAHVAAATTTAVVAMILVREGAPHLRPALGVAGTLGAVLVVVVAADRVLLGRHYPTDVAAGILLGVTVALAAAAVSGVSLRQPPAHAPQSGRTSANTASRSSPSTKPAAIAASAAAR